MKKSKKQIQLTRCSKCIYYQCKWHYGWIESGICSLKQIQRYADDLSCSKIEYTN